LQKYGKKYELDWLLLAALGYQESRLNQAMVSHAGAIGIMQIKASTAAHAPILIPNIQSTENNVHAGAKYLRHLIDHYFQDSSIDSLNQALFALAAYNAGPVRIHQLRKDALAQGLDPNVWFDQVEVIAAKEIGRETVEYVSNIYKYYTSYLYLREYGRQSGKKLLSQNSSLYP
jgi:membrane-bound lytic murein transglycosylase MltF